MTPPIFPGQIGKLIPRLGSTFDGEVVATAQRDWREQANVCRVYGRYRLTDTELKFVEDIGHMANGRYRRAPTEKQLAWLEAIYQKLQREAA